MKKSGVYAIEHIQRRTVYIGSTSHIVGRWSNHRYNLRRNKHPNRVLQTDWKNEGEQAFVFILLEECTPDRLKERELFWFDQYKGNTYNSFSPDSSISGKGITREIANEIRKEYGEQNKSCGVTLKSLAVKYEISVGMVHHIISGKAWK